MKASQSCRTPATVTEDRSVRFVTPRYSITSQTEASELRVELPGIDKANVQIALEDSELRIEATSTASQPESWKALHRETSDRSYRLRLRLGDQVNQAAISADLEDGVLVLTIPKAEEAKPRAIKVK